MPTRWFRPKISPRVHGLFVIKTYPSEYKRAEPLPQGTYFRSTLEASRFLGFSSDVVGCEVRKNVRKGWEPFAEKAGVLFVTAEEAFVNSYPTLENEIRKLFPFLFVANPSSADRKPSLRPARLRTGKAPQRIAENWDYCI